MMHSTPQPVRSLRPAAQRQEGTRNQSGMSEMAEKPQEDGEKLAMKRKLCRAIVGLQEAILSNEHDTAGSLAQVSSLRHSLHVARVVCYVWCASTGLGSQPYNAIAVPALLDRLHPLYIRSKAI
jgi:hypothetical protein